MEIPLGGPEQFEKLVDDIYTFFYNFFNNEGLGIELLTLG